MFFSILAVSTLLVVNALGHIGSNFQEAFINFMTNMLRSCWPDSLNCWGWIKARSHLIIYIYIWGDGHRWTSICQLFGQVTRVPGSNISHDFPLTRNACGTHRRALGLPWRNGRRRSLPRHAAFGLNGAGRSVRSWLAESEKRLLCQGECRVFAAGKRVFGHLREISVTLQ